MHTRIISIRNPAPANAAYVERISSKHSKHIRRKEYVDTVLFPLISKSFDDTQLFDAITPDDYTLVNNIIKFKGVQFKFAGTFPANFLSNYMLWKQCVELNEPMLILEDDALLPENKVETVKKAIEEFLNLPNGNHFLYLLSQHPQNTKMKDFTMSEIVPFDKHFFSIRPLPNTNSDQIFEDIGGTAAYVITPDTAQTLCKLAESEIGENTDRFIGKSNANKHIKMLFYKEYGDLFILYEQLSDWNMIHKNLVPPKWEDLSPDWQASFLMGKTIRLVHNYVDESKGAKLKDFSLKEIDAYIECAKQKKTDFGTYGPTDVWLHEALDIIPIVGKRVAIMGSTSPWYEAMAIAYGGMPTTVEYNLPNYGHPLIKEILLTDLVKSGYRFDIAFSISSFEHDGLGRYGDPLNPNGDIRAMQEMKKILEPNGLLFLAVPMGQDQLVWNVHRIYGHQRLKFLIEGWEVVGAVGYEPDTLNINMSGGGSYQPILVLKNIGYTKFYYTDRKNETGDFVEGTFCSGETLDIHKNIIPERQEERGMIYAA